MHTAGTFLLLAGHCERVLGVRWVGALMGARSSTGPMAALP